MNKFDQLFPAQSKKQCLNRSPKILKDQLTKWYLVRSAMKNSTTKKFKLEAEGVNFWTD